MRILDPNQSQAGLVHSLVLVRPPVFLQNSFASVLLFASLVCRVEREGAREAVGYDRAQEWMLGFCARWRGLAFARGGLENAVYCPYGGAVFADFPVIRDSLAFV